MRFIDEVPASHYLRIYDASGWNPLTDSQYELLRLELCFEEHLFTPEEGALFLVSASPIIVAPRWDEEGRYEPLPGSTTFSDPSLSIEDYEFFLEKELRIPRCFVGNRPKAPRELLTMSLENGHEPPWYQPLLKKPDLLKKLLPGWSENKCSNSKSYAAKQRHQGDPQHQAKCMMLKAADERKALGSFNHAVFKKEMRHKLAAKPNRLCEVSSIDRWMTQIKKDWEIPGRYPWIELARKRDYDGFDSADSLPADS